ncbi:uncharacterized protein GGS22DRAFT_162614 [Annulohypoxylon maeteangense]|uniref:uncharacterized protein n=1 Tax=Annulohypoxylon maeteangense TaxID=1927788 RepID=UPI002008C9AB|nr:uncharacterized protein GGS22DRAFT_162614 [Annulohypoxylon maeteangense]KAI0885053.1 hypothetical protein GGS22DRAFT_162614 [Annulohypoxylon maeteangense]
MPADRTSSKRSGQRQTGLTRNTRSRKQNVDVLNEKNEPAHTSEGDLKLTGPIDGNTGLDWDWVKTLDQNPEGKSYFPAQFTPPTNNPFTGDDDNQPEVTDDTDLTEYTSWVLAKVKKAAVSKAVVSMMKDPDLKAKWAISLNNHHFYRIRRRRELKLVQFQSPPTNYEAAYAAMVGIVLPPERACKNCKANQGPFQNCIVVPGYLRGACAGCHYNSSGSRCSHRPDGSKRFRVAGVSTYVPFSSLARIATADRSQPTADMAPRAMRDVKAKLRDIINEIEEYERQGLIGVS